jgi:hypothetical protein
VDDREIAERLEKQDAFWNGPRLTYLMFASIAVAIVVLWVISSIRSGDFSWMPLAHDPVRELPPSGW